MAKLLVLLTLCLLPAIATATGRQLSSSHPLYVSGRAYCDTCRCGFETTATTYIPGAKVRIECKDRDTQELRYTVEGVTDSTGTYNIKVEQDHGDDTCDAVLVSSPEIGCTKAAPGRDRARVILTRNNGMASDNRAANAMGFMKDEPLAECSQVLQQYFPKSEDI